MTTSYPFGKKWPYGRLGMVYRHQGDVAAARRSFEAALALEPKHKEARRELRNLR